MIPIQVPPTVVPAWIGNERMFMAVNHNRYDCGIYLRAGDSIRVKVSHNDVSFNLWNDDSETEQNLTLSAHDMSDPDDYFEHVVEHDSVPFFECLLNGNEYTAQIWASTTRQLPKFTHGVSDRFEWPDKAPFALLSSKYIQILVPFIDRPVLADAVTIDSILAWYEDVITFYDALIGLDVDVATVPKDRGRDKNVNKRFFAKANISGSGAAYYNNLTMGQSNSSVEHFYLRPLPTNWGGLHEIAHAYDFHFVRSGPVPLNEVWNNILCDAYQSRYLELDEKSVNSPNSLTMGRNIVRKIENGKVFDSYNLFEKLAVFSYIMDMDAGVFARINREWRAYQLGEPIGNEHFLPRHFVPPMQTWWAELSQLDLVPLFSTMLLPCDDWQLKERNRLAVDRPAVIFQGLFDADAPVPLALKTIHEDPNATGEATITIHIADFGDIAGQTMSLVAGAQIAHSFRLTAPSFTIRVVSGIYKVFMPRGRGNLTYTITTSNYENYLLVHKNYCCECHVHYSAQNSSFLSSEFGRFYGLNDRNGGFLCVDYIHKQIKILSINPSVNWNYNDTIYVMFSLFDTTDNNKVEDEFRIVGRNMPYTQHVYADLKIGGVYAWTIFHQQASMERMNFMLQDTHRVDYEFTRYGVARRGIDAAHTARQRLLTKIKNCVDYINKSQLRLFNVDNLFADSIYAAVNQFDDDEDKKILLREYQNYLPLRFRPAVAAPSGPILLYAIIAVIVAVVAIIFLILYKNMATPNTSHNLAPNIS
ncbi:enhancin-like [Choristoneura fumiferana multiple nucleopolyhedrovirus]|uniref:Enhancin-like n=1 Tax=Choristoneura fumiferana nuclear polyhedrosis virus TaxID=208973 RepID=Q7TLV7_NPVCF|nr:enhancin-like [Choristoneura fumiferana multiple nucleopolyhedrovirus]AAP29820.1 enhancin-like [Choristoneura fumiferana multiple nucleopolyhedrovirus]